MLEYTPVHIAYSGPFFQHAELSEQADVSADKADDFVELNLKVDLSHLLLVNLILNFVLLILVITLMRK